MKQIGLWYTKYHDNYGKGPSEVENLEEFAVGHSTTYAKLKEGQFILIWDTWRSDMTAGPSNTILGYPSTAPSKGGAVLMGDGSIKRMTHKEFQETPKAKPRKK